MDTSLQRVFSENVLKKLERSVKYEEKNWKNKITQDISALYETHAEENFIFTGINVQNE